MKKRLFGILTALTLCLTLLPAAALAESEYVASVTVDTTNNYSTFEQALAYANDITDADKTVTLTLLDNCSVSSDQTITRSMTLDLGGKKLSGGNYSLIIDNGATVTIQGNSEADSITVNCLSMKLTANAGSTLTIASGKFRGEVMNYGTATINGGTISLFNSFGTLTVEGGTFDSAFQNFGTATIQGGTFNKSVSNSGYDNLTYQGTLTITGGTFNSQVNNSKNAGKLTLKGGTFKDKIETYRSGETVQDLLISNYGYRYYDSNGKLDEWYQGTEASVTPPEDKSIRVEPAPLKSAWIEPSTCALTVGYTGQRFGASSTSYRDYSSDVRSYQWYLGTAQDTLFVDGNETGRNSAFFNFPIGKPVGTYHVGCAITLKGYTLKSNIVTVTVSKQTQTVTADDVTVTYGETDKSVSASGYGDVTYAVTSGSDVVDVNSSTGALTIKKAGTATITATAAGNDTYSEGSRTITVTVNKKEISVNTIQFNGRQYTGGTETRVHAVTFNGLVNGETLEWNEDFTDSVNFTNKDVGTWPVSGTLTLTSSEKASNYCFENGSTTTTVSGSADISKFLLNGVAVTVADKPYDGTTAAEVTSAALYTGNGETLTRGVDYTITASFCDADVGNGKSVSYTIAPIDNDKTKNYDFSAAVSGVCEESGSITKATVTITAADKSAYANDTAPDLSSPVLGTDYTLSGLVNGETLGSSVTIVLTCDADMSRTGDYDIVPTVTGEDSRYEFVCANGKLTISDRQPMYIPSPTYAVTAPDADNGTVTVNRRYAEEGDIVTITVTPDKGYTLETLTVTDRKGSELKLTDKGSGKYTFKMPAGKVEITAIFAEETLTEDTSMPNFFVDVTADKYYYDAVLWAARNGITGGTDENHFGPDASCSRAQLVTFLWRAMGQPVVNYPMSFTDVDEDSYCGEAVRWANSSGIVSGYGNGLFGTDDAITREQMAVILYRFAIAMGMDVSVGEDTNILSYNDVFQVSEYALPAFQWAVGAGIVQGADGSLMPAASCTRAQIVTVLYRLLGE